MSNEIKNETEQGEIARPLFTTGDDGQSIIITMPEGVKRVLTWNYLADCDWFLDNVKKPSLVGLLNDLMPWASILQIKNIAFSLYTIRDTCNEISRLNQLLKEKGGSE